jgi:putative transposase
MKEQPDSDRCAELIRSPKTGPLRISELFAVVSPGWKERKTTKASQFSDAQKAFILKQGNDGVPVADICRKAGISQATYFNWKKKYEGMQPPEMQRLKQLEDENAKLKKIVADLAIWRAWTAWRDEVRTRPHLRSLWSAVYDYCFRTDCERHRARSRSPPNPPSDSSGQRPIGGVTGRGSSTIRSGNAVGGDENGLVPGM